MRLKFLQRIVAVKSLPQCLDKCFKGRMKPSIFLFHVLDLPSAVFLFSFANDVLLDFYRVVTGAADTFLQELNDLTRTEKRAFHNIVKWNNRPAHIAVFKDFVGGNIVR